MQRDPWGLAARTPGLWRAVRQRRAEAASRQKDFLRPCKGSTNDPTNLHINITLHSIALHSIALHCIALHTYIHTYIYIYIYVCVCVCASYAEVACLSSYGSLQLSPGLAQRVVLAHRLVVGRCGHAPEPNNPHSAMDQQFEI